MAASVFKEMRWEMKETPIHYHRCAALNNKEIKNICLDTLFYPDLVTILVLGADAAVLSIDRRHATHSEYQTRINFCPFCGIELANDAVVKRAGKISSR